MHNRIAWKYGTSVEGPFNQEMAGLVNDTIKPSFPDLGTYYLVCEVTKEMVIKCVIASSIYHLYR
jgi:hypothetical protein